MLTSSISSLFNLGRLSSLSFCPSLLGCPFTGTLLPIVVSYGVLYFCSVGFKFSFYISDFTDLGPLPFSLDEFSSRFINFVYLFKDQLLASLIFCIFCSSSFFFVCSALWFFFLLLSLDFVCSSFSSCFRYIVRLFEFFLVSWGRLVLLWTSL